MDESDRNKLKKILEQRTYQPEILLGIIIIILLIELILLIGAIMIQEFIIAVAIAVLLVMNAMLYTAFDEFSKDIRRNREVTRIVVSHLLEENIIKKK